MVTTIELPVKGGYTLIDKADEELVKGFDWRIAGAGYVMAQRGQLYLYMHRLIAGAGAGQNVDHINMDILDNRSCNLRFATKTENAANRGADRRRLGTTSKHKGVSWKKERGYWVAYIHVNGKTRYIGSFEDEESAARAYNKVAIETWGEFARLNDA